VTKFCALEKGRSAVSGLVGFTALLCAFLTAGCANTGTAIDRTYRKRVASFSMPVGVTINPGGTIQIGVTPQWTYRLPETAGLKK
jgi:hypothetical protein